MAEINSVKRNQAFNYKATVKIDRPLTPPADGSWDEKKPSSGKFLLVAVGLIVLALVFFLR